MLVAGWALFCALTGLRGPATLAAALHLPAPQVPRGAALLMASTPGIGSAVSQGAALLQPSWGAAGPMALVAAVLLLGALPVRRLGEADLRPMAGLPDPTERLNAGHPPA